MKKNAKILIASAAGIAVLGGGVAVLALTKPIESTESDNSSTEEKIAVTEYKADDIASLKITNENGEYTIVREGSEKWSVSSIPQEYANNSAYGSAMEKAGAIEAKQTVESSGDLTKFGFDKPTATFAMTFKDGKYEAVNCTVGMKNEGENAWYLKTDKDDTVYLVSNSYLTFTMGEDLDYVNLSGLVDAYNAESDIVNRIRIERPDLEKDIVLDKLPEKDEDKEFASVYVAYEMSSHNNILVDDELGQDVTFGMFELVAVDAVAVKPTDEEKKAYGLDSPSCTVTMVKNEDEVTKLYVGDAMYNTVTDEKTGEATKTVIGYYAMLSGKDVIYVLDPDCVPWATVEAKDILYRLIFTPYIYYLDAVVAKDSDGKEYKLEIIGDSSNSSFKYNGEELKAANFKSFFQYLLSAYAEEIYNDPLTAENKFVCGFTYDYRDEGEKSDVVEFYSSEKDRTCIIVVNGDVRYKVRQIYGQRFLENLDALLSGGEIKQEF